MYYAAIPRNTTKHCIGVATSQTILGPYEPQDHPFLCSEGQTGAIDGNGFMNGDDRYVIYKNGSAKSLTAKSHVALQKVQANGYTKIGDPVTLYNSTKADSWDSEGPALVARPGGGFVAFFAIGFFKNTDYTIDYATADKIDGPYTPRGTLLKTGTYEGISVTAPGAPDFVGRNASQMIFTSDTVNHYGSRSMYIATLRYEGNNVSLVQGEGMSNGSHCRL